VVDIIVVSEVEGYEGAKVFEVGNKVDVGCSIVEVDSSREFGVVVYCLSLCLGHFGEG